jgi:UDP-2,3-diacylglucosamine hydrolase
LIKKYYFASDVHLGLPPSDKAIEREKRFVRWLDSIKSNAEGIFLVGDVFDFWFEYKKVVPRGFVRTLGKIAEITDSGVPVHFFAGNHDLWVSDYLQSETGVNFHSESYETTLYEKKFFIAHGDTLDPSDKGYMFMHSIFTNPFLRKMYASLHPSIGVGFAHTWAHRRHKQNRPAGIFRGRDDSLYKFALKKLDTEKIDFFVFGHRHAPATIKIKRAICNVLPDWIARPGGYMAFDGENTEMVLFPPNC